MPGRLIPLVNNEIYHVYNRGIDRRPTFISKKELDRALEAIKFYRICSPISLSKFLLLNQERKDQVLNLRKNSDGLVEVIAFCLMPNHFHFLLRQISNNGISKFLSNFQNSYTRYFNTKRKRDGSLFLDQFKAVRIETDEQLLHVSRYIHLNPYTTFVVKTKKELVDYPWSSLPYYVEGGEGDKFVSLDVVLSFFKSVESYQQFVLDQADYQRKLHEIKHLTLENP